MAKHFAILSVKAELEQILCGLSSTLNVLQLIRENSEAMQPLFFYNPPPSMTWDELFDLLHPTMSPEGSNKREAEEAVVMKWIKLIQMIEGISYNVLVNTIVSTIASVLWVNEEHKLCFNWLLLVGLFSINNSLYFSFMWNSYSESAQ